MTTVAGMGNTSDATPGPMPHNPAGHRPVLLHPLIQNLQPQHGEVVVDGTLGAGGVTASLLAAVTPGGRVIAIDRDPAAVASGRRRFASAGDRVVIEHGDFADAVAIIARHDLDAVDAVTLDLGISSVQLDDPERGFAFRLDGPLDMRIDQTSGDASAADIVNGWSEADLVDLIRVYGEERYAKAIVGRIAQRRRSAPLITTTDLREVVERAVPRNRWPKRIHPATKTFQALRIEVNHELASLDRGLQAAITILRPGGRLGVIAFHSLEDTLVKNALHVAAMNCICPPQQPICTCVHRASLSLITRRAVKATDDEITANPRARSARLRVAMKLEQLA